MPAGRVVHLGGSSAAAAARLLGRGDPQHLLLAHPQVSDHVCRWLGVPALSDSLSEQLDSEASDLTPLDAIGSVQLGQLRVLLAAPEFAAAVFSIAAAHAAAVPSLRQLDLGAVSRLCGAASQGGRLRFVVRLATKVVLRAGGRDVTRDAASRQVMPARSALRMHCAVWVAAGVGAAATSVFVPPQSSRLLSTHTRCLSRTPSGV
jgi:hypothetical protein